MSYYLRSSDHYYNVAKELSEDEVFSDLVFVTNTDTLHGHSALILPHLPALASLVNTTCTGHTRLCIILPMIRTEILQAALLHFYMRGDVSRLENVLGVTTHNIKEEVEEDIKDKNIGQEYTNKISVIQYNNTQATTTGKDILTHGHEYDTLKQEETTVVNFGIENTVNDCEIENIPGDDLSPRKEKDNLEESSLVSAQQIHPTEEKKVPKPCHLCDKIFYNGYNLKQHLISRHKVFPPKMKIYNCTFPECSFVTGSRVAFQRHLKTSLSHPDLRKDEVKKTKFSCETCNEVFATNSSRKRHIIRRHN